MKNKKGKKPNPYTTIVSYVIYYAAFVVDCQV